MISNSDKSLTVTIKTARHNEITNNINRVEIRDIDLLHTIHFLIKKNLNYIFLKLFSFYCTNDVISANEEKF